MYYVLLILAFLVIHLIRVIFDIEWYDTPRKRAKRKAERERERAQELFRVEEARQAVLKRDELTAQQELKHRQWRESETAKQRLRDEARWDEMLREGSATGICAPKAEPPDEPN